MTGSAADTADSVAAFAQEWVRAEMPPTYSGETAGSCARAAHVCARAPAASTWRAPRGLPPAGKDAPLHLPSFLYLRPARCIRPYAYALRSPVLSAAAADLARIAKEWQERTKNESLNRPAGRASLAIINM